MTNEMQRQGRNKVWVNFNSLNTKFCWVTGGVNATCPYSAISLAQANEKIDVLVRDEFLRVEKCLFGVQIHMNQG